MSSGKCIKYLASTKPELLSPALKTPTFQDKIFRTDFELKVLDLVLLSNDLLSKKLPLNTVFFKDERRKGGI